MYVLTNYGFSNTQHLDGEKTTLIVTDTILLGNVLGTLLMKGVFLLLSPPFFLFSLEPRPTGGVGLFPNVCIGLADPASQGPLLLLTPPPSQALRSSHHFI